MRRKNARSRRTSPRVVLALFVLAAGFAVTATSAHADSGATWVVSPTPNVGTHDNELRGVSCPSATVCVAAGDSYNGSGEQTLVETWDGSSWSVTPSPNANINDHLRAVSCSSTTACVAAGDYNDESGPFQTLVETWDGSNWSVVTSPSATGDNHLTGVSCTSTTNCVAVGYSQDESSTDTLIETWDGLAWTITPSPNPSGDAHFESVSCTSTASCVAAGAYYDGSAEQTLIETWDGTSWTITPSPNQGTSDNFLEGVSCVDATHCFAAGEAFISGIPQTLAESWDGSTWTIASSPDQGTTANSFAGISCIDASTCVAVGEYDGGSAWQTLVETWDGTSWTITPSSNQTGDNYLSGVGCATATKCVAVFEYYSSSVNHTLAVFTGYVPDAPTDVAATAGPGSASVTWTAAADNGSAIESYTASCASDDGGAPGSATSASTNVDVGGLTNGATYTCTVTATNAPGTGPPSAESNGVMPATVPGAPRSPSAIPGNARATVTWAVPVSNGGDGIYGYDVTPYLAGVAQPVRMFNSAATTEIVTGLTNAKSYTFKIAAKNILGTGPQSGASASIVVGSPTKPTFLSASAGNAAATVRWSAPSSNNGSAITGYIVTPYLGTVAQPARVFNSTATTETVTGLTNAKTYTFRIAAKNARGVGPAAVSYSVLVGAPTAPTALSATAGVKKATLHWTAPNANGAPITAYIVTLYRAGVVQTTRTFNSAATTETFTGLTTAKTYTFKVAAKNSRGTGPQSAPSNAVTPT